jgi:thermostable 8-oxoguanine DNA glycosylase
MTEATKQTSQYEELKTKVDDYFNLIVGDKYYLGKSRQYSLRRDITWHCRSIKWIHSLIQDEIDSLKPKEFKENFEDSIMCYKPPNINRIYSEVDSNFGKIKLFLKFVRDFEGDPEENLNRLFDPSDKVHISGMGPFVISQFLAGAHPREYTIIEDRMVDTMKNLNLIDTKVKSSTPKGYLYINEICKKLLSDVFSKQIEQNKRRLGFNVDEDFGLVFIHEFFWEYEEFSSYDATKLEEAIGEKRKTEEAETDWNLGVLGELE